MKKFDLISEHINLKFEGNVRHRTLFGGLISIMVIILSLAFGIYSSMDLFYRSSPIVNSSAIFFEDAGTFDFSQKGIFHYAALQKMGEGDSHDPRLVTYIGMMKDYYDNILAYYEYNECDVNSDVPEFAKEIFTTGACIKKFINATTNEEIIRTEDNKNEFPYPFMAKGVDTVKFKDQNTKFQFFALECRNNTSKSDCYPEEEIKTKLLDYYYNFYFLDYNIDSYQPNNPGVPFLNSAASAKIGLDSVVNHLNLKSVIYESNEGWLLNGFDTYTFSKFMYNERVIEPRSDDSFPIVYSVNFWQKNISDHFKRRYAKIQDVIAGLGGIVRALTLFGTILNYFLNQLQYILDTSEVVNKFNLFSTSVRKFSVIQESYPDLIRKDKLTVTKYVISKLSCRKQPNTVYELMNLRNNLINEENLVKLSIEMYKLKNLLLGADQMKEFKEMKIFYDQFMKEIKPQSHFSTNENIKKLMNVSRFDSNIIEK